MMCRIVLALVLAVSLSVGVSHATPGGPLGGDESGCYPLDKDTKKCQDAVAKAAAKALGCIMTCHAKRASGKFADDTAEEACESTDPVKSCKAKYDKATGPTSKINALCPPCLPPAARDGVFATIESTLDNATNAAIYCAPGVGPFGGDDQGIVPTPKSNDKKCEDAVAKALSKASTCVMGCGMKLAGGKLADDTAEDACESGPVKSCKSKYDASTGPTSKINAICPGCLDALTRGNQFGNAEAQLDALGGDIYCCEVTTTTTSTTTTTCPPVAPLTVLKGALTPTTGLFNYNLTLGIPGSDAACNTNFPGTHTCTFAELKTAEAACDLVGLKDTALTTVTVFWAIDSTRPDTQQCHQVVAWDYQTAHTGHFADVSSLNTSTGALGPVTGGLCLNMSWVGCCL
jgi:hypothetical protein